MRLVEHVTIRNFRSIEVLELDLGDLTAFIGTNGSGKSNIFRALNLFFNGFIEGNEPLDFGRDFHRPWRTTKNRFIEVDVRFALPSYFSIRSEIRSGLISTGIRPSGTFTLRKRWTRDQARDDLNVEDVLVRGPGNQDFKVLSSDNVRGVARFLRVIKFRYVPNHVHPSELIKAENAALQEELLRAVRRVLRASKNQSERDLDAILAVVSTAAKDLVGPVTGVLQATPGEVSALELATPGEWADVVWSLALKLQGSDKRSLDVGVHGSGNQSFLMFVLTHFLDTRFGQEFGWHQATIWALEEPESFLHADLKNQLASFLVEASGARRFQTFTTTHELLFAAAADARFEVTLEAGLTGAIARDPLDLAERTLGSGVTSFVHPLNLTAPKPTLLVDGPLDVFYLTEAYRHSGRTNPWSIRSLEELDPAAGGSGKERTKKYLKQNQGPLRARPAGSPVIVLLDWEDSEQDRESFADLVSAHPTSTATIWPVDRANPELDDTFRGIERFLSTELVRASALSNPQGGILQAVGPTSSYSVLPTKKAAAKQLLRRTCVDRNDPADVRLITDVLSWLEGHLPGTQAAATLPGL